MVLGAFALLLLGGIAFQKNLDKGEASEAAAREELLVQSWADIARRTGLRLVRKSPYGLALHGVLDGVPVWFAQFAIRDGRDVWWGVRAELPSNCVPLAVVPADKVPEEQAAKNIPTGDEEFDLVYALQADNAVDAFHTISRAARQALLALGPAHLRTTPGVMELTVPFSETELDDARIVAALELVRALALPPKAREQTVN